MSGVDDELSSVRVEVDGAAFAGPDAPEVAGSSGGGSKFVLVLAVLTVAAVVAAVVALRPGSDEAADGTERSVPTSTVAPEEAADSGGIEVEEEAEEAELNEVIPILVDSGSGILQIVPAGVGYLGLAGDQTAPTPRVLRSFDGQDWFDLESTVVTPDGPNFTEANWFNLLAFEEGFLLTQVDFIDQVIPEMTAYVSDDGGEWVELVLSGDTAPSFFATNASSSAIFGGSLGRDPVIEAFFIEHTTLEIPENGVCEIAPQVFGDSQPRMFDVFDCTGEQVAVVDASVIRPELVANDVLACIEIVGLVSGGSAFQLVRQDLDGEFASYGPINIFTFPSDLADGAIAMVDWGNPFIDEQGPCEDFLPLAPEGPAILVADKISNELQRFDLPSERFTFPGETTTLSPEQTLSIVGEVNVGEERELVVQLGEALSALNLDTGAWSNELTSLSLPRSDGFDQQVVLSESGTRAYAIADSLLLTFDFIAGVDGELQVIETTMPISLTEGPGSGVNFTDPLYADDELLFISNGDQTWAIETPPVSGE